MYLIINIVKFAKIILLKLTVCHLIRLKYYHSRFLKNDDIFKQNLFNIKLLLQFK